MRIKQNKLPVKPDKSYVRFVCGVHAMVLLYHEPCYCVNTIITDKDGKVTKHCYPLTKEQYDVYMAGSVEEQNKLIAKGGKIIYGRS